MEYQNIFTQVQVQGPAEMGIDPAGTLDRERTNNARFSKTLGWFGNAQLGPIYLGTFGLVSMATGFIWFFIIGMNSLENFTGITVSRHNRNGSGIGGCKSTRFIV